MNYFYGGIWLVIGLILMFSLSKENKIFRFIGSYFLVLGGWWIANELVPTVDLFAGAWGLAIKIISGLAIVVIGIFYYNNFWKTKKKK